MTNELNEIVFSTAIGFSKRDVVINGLESCIEASVRSLCDISMGRFTDLVIQKLTEYDNQYQFTLIIKELEK